MVQVSSLLAAEPAVYFFWIKNKNIRVSAYPKNDCVSVVYNESK